MPKSSIPASSLGLSVVHLLTCAATWKAQRWMRVSGQTAAAALAKPGDPSQTAILGAGTLSMSAAHAEEHSVWARCQATTRPSAIAMSTTAFLRSRIPSRNTTSRTSPAKGAIGHILHIQAVFRQNVALPTLGSAIDSLENSHRRNALRAFAALSIVRVADAPHLGQRHRLVPALVVLFPFILAPHTLQVGLFTRDSCP